MFLLDDLRALPVLFFTLDIPVNIPWHAKVVNSVNLIGRVKIPVQFEAFSDENGRDSAPMLYLREPLQQSYSSELTILAGNEMMVWTCGIGYLWCAIFEHESADRVLSFH
ncbi:hypothetical protein M8C21_028799 [Ambrosia artemisiifolia]|uniref:Uncharacterized protein n=1 Tax=Ambrosia artemisiifolia TaxID=4212 RepID=A0AAD5GED2_AMBAR|nr:hypothetical protein M8C21_028799 [Ambrosia artemisiifolia]